MLHSLTLLKKVFALSLTENICTASRENICTGSRLVSRRGYSTCCKHLNFVTKWNQSFVLEC